MGKPLRALIVEDSEGDVMLILRALGRGGYDPTHQRVDTADAMRAALEGQDWDVILSDYAMPQFSAPVALKLVQETGLDLPFIIVSGTIGEDAAVVAMKAGAHDFFAKDNLTRLIPAIEREVREAGERRQRRETEKKLRQAEERFARAFLGSPVGITISQPDGRFLDVNDRALTLLGFDREEMIGHTAPELNIWVHAKEQVQVEELLRKPQPGREIEIECRTKSGEIRNVLASFDIIELSDEDCILTAFQDITERKKAEAELNALYNATSYLFKADSLLNLGHQIVEAVIKEFKQAECGLMLVDRRQSRVIRLARAGQYQVKADFPLLLDGPGLVPEAVRTRKLVYAPDVTRVPNYVVGETQTASELAVPLNTVNGVIAILDLQSTRQDAFSERDQRVLMAFGERAAAAIEVMRLYEELNQHAAELEWRVAQRTAELQRTKEHVETILNHSADGIILIDADGNIQRTNPAFYQMFGLSGEIREKSWKEFIEPSEREKCAAALLTIIQQRQPTRVELTCVRGDGTLFDTEAALAPLTRDENDDLQVVCSLRDISQRKQLEVELREALAVEKELNELKSRFVSMVTHEFRTPLTVILSSSELIKKYRDQIAEEKQLEKLEVIGTQVRHLTALLDDVLIIGRGDTKGLMFNPERLNLETFCRNILDEIRPLATGHEIRLTLNDNCDQADLDPKLMRQVLYNLLSNAIKYSPQGSMVSLELSCHLDTAIMRVTDEGIGIPEVDQARLFEAFYRAGNVDSIEGTGLGLAIAKRAVEAHGGNINVESEVGKGTTFVVSVPLGQSPNTGA